MAPKADDMTSLEALEAYKGVYNYDGVYPTNHTENTE
jgi:hypothetical protein